MDFILLCFPISTVNGIQHWELQQRSGVIANILKEQTMVIKACDPLKSTMLTSIANTITPQHIFTQRPRCPSQNFLSSLEPCLFTKPTVNPENKQYVSSVIIKGPSNQ